MGASSAPPGIKPLIRPFRPPSPVPGEENSRLVKNLTATHSWSPVNLASHN